MPAWTKSLWSPVPTFLGNGLRDYSRRPLFNQIIKLIAANRVYYPYMEIRIKTTDYQMTQEVSNYLEERLSHIEKFLSDGVASARVEVEVGKAEGHHKHSEHQYFAELQLVRPGFSRLVAKNNEPTINAAIDNAKDELMRQLRQDKRLHTRVWRKGGAFAKKLLRWE